MPSSAVTAFTGRRAVRSGALWGLLFGLVNMGSASGYVGAYKTAASRSKLAASFSGNVGMSALLGVPHHLDHMAGFVAWRAVGFLALVGGVWGLLFTTRALRGEEDAGRWQLLLTGPTTRRQATAEAIAGIGAGVASLFVVTTLLTVGAGRTENAFGPGAAAYLALTLAGSAALFAAVGAVASQVAPTRRYANTIGGAVMAGSFLIRMVADSKADRAWLRWASPLGWVENLRPLTGSHLGAVVPLAGAVALLAVAACRLADARDAGEGALGDNASGESRGLLGSPTALAARLTLPSTVAWATGLAAVGLVGGLVGKEASHAYSASASVQRVLARLGGRASEVSVLGMIFLIAAVLIAVCAAGQAIAAREEESNGLVDHLLVRPVERWRWLAGRGAVAALGLVAVSLVLGLLAWIGAGAHGGALGLGPLLKAGLNAVPPGLFVLGAGVLAFGVAPRRVAVVTYGLVLWSFLVEFIAAAVDANPLLLDTSLLHHVAPAPAAHPNWPAAAVMTALAVVAAALGAAAFARRDVAPA